MSSKYDSLYREDANVCGSPFPEYVAFAQRGGRPGLTVLDLGCGQGRDAFVFARQGYRVVGVDVSATGIAQVSARAKTVNLPIEGIMADIVTYQPTEKFDVVILDRTLHMLPHVADRLTVLATAISALRPHGHILIADEKPNLPALHDFLVRDNRLWEFQSGLKPSFLFATLR